MRLINTVKTIIVTGIVVTTSIGAQPKIKLSTTSVNMGDTIKVDIFNQSPLIKKKIVKT